MKLNYIFKITATVSTVACFLLVSANAFAQKLQLNNLEYFETNGNKLFQYVKTSKGWRISSVIWEDEKV